MKLILVALLFTLTACVASAPKPKLVSYTYPPYPAQAFHDKQTGLVVAMFDVNQVGHVENIRILSAQPKGAFDATVKSTLAKWQYEKNKPAQDMTMRFIFNLTHDY